MNIFKLTHSMGFILILIGTILSLITIVIIGPFNITNTDKINTIDIVNLTNKQRSLLDKKPLSANTDLMNTAQKRAEALAQQLELSHENPSQISTWEYLKDVNYPFLLAGENIAIGSITNQETIQSWMQSITHKTNIINSSYNDIGVGIANYYSPDNNQNQTITVALFATQTNDGKNNSLEPTFPAGPIYINTSPNNLTSYLLLAISFILIIFGGFIEFRQIQRHSQLQNQNITNPKNK